MIMGCVLTSLKVWTVRLNCGCIVTKNSYISDKFKFKPDRSCYLGVTRHGLPTLSPHKFLFYNKKEGNDQESIQPSTTPDIGY